MEKKVRPIHCQQALKVEVSWAKLHLLLVKHNSTDGGISKFDPKARWKSWSCQNERGTENLALDFTIKLWARLIQREEFFFCLSFTQSTWCLWSSLLRSLHQVTNTHIHSYHRGTPCQDRSECSTLSASRTKQHLGCRFVWLQLNRCCICALARWRNKPDITSSSSSIVTKDSPERATLLQDSVPPLHLPPSTSRWRIPVHGYNEPSSDLHSRVGIRVCGVEELALCWSLVMKLFLNLNNKAEKGWISAWIMSSRHDLLEFLQLFSLYFYPVLVVRLLSRSFQRRFIELAPSYRGTRLTRGKKPVRKPQYKARP